MNIAYSAHCQTCKVAGKESRLHRDLSAPETIFCTQGHKFSGPEIEDYLTAAPGEGTRVGNSPVAEEEFVPMPQVPAPAVEQLQRELQEAVERTSPFELSPPPSAPEPGKHGEATALSVLHHEEEAARKMAVRAPWRLRRLPRLPPPWQSRSLPCDRRRQPLWTHTSRESPSDSFPEGLWRLPW